MDNLQDEMADSRTLGVGRKRDFTEATNYEESMYVEDSSDEGSFERSRKRVKEAHELPHATVHEDGILINSASPLRVKPHPGEEAKTLSVPPNELPTSAGVPSMTWNSGVQSGLRTSFARKKQAHPMLESSRGGIEDRDELAPFSSSNVKPTDVGEHMAETLQSAQDRPADYSEGMDGMLMNNTTVPNTVASAQPGSSSSTPAPFKVLSKKQQQRLSPEQRKAYQDAAGTFRRERRETKRERKQAETAQQLHNVPLSGPNSGFGDTSSNEVDEHEDDTMHPPQDQSPDYSDSEHSMLVNDTTAPGSAASAQPNVVRNGTLGSFKLTKKAIKQLTPAERQTYFAAGRAYKEQRKQEAREKRRVKDAQESNNESLQSDEIPGLTSGTFKKLSTKQQDELSTREKKLYDQAAAADKVQRKQGRLEKCTEQIEAAFAQSAKLSQNLVSKMSQGKTLFPRKRNENTFKYRNKSGDFKMSEVFDENGRPIKVDNFSFDTFVFSFIKDNRDKWDALTQKVLLTTFNLYVTHLYGHVLNLVPWLQSSPFEPDALTIEQAKEQVSRMLAGQIGAPKMTGSAILGNADKPNQVQHCELPSSTDRTQAVVPSLINGPERPTIPKPNFVNSASLEQNEEAIGGVENFNTGDATNQSLQGLVQATDKAMSSPNPVMENKPELRKDEDDSRSKARCQRCRKMRKGCDHQRPCQRCKDAGLGADQSVSEDESDGRDGRDQDIAMHESGPTMPIVSTSVDVQSTETDLSEMELKLQQKYFPSNNPISRCLACAQTGHSTLTCPALSCTVCGVDGNHSTMACPLNLRCGKCRERGHHSSQCPEKLARAKTEAIPCDICGSKDHVEVACHFIWRSFVPKPEEIRTVRDIPVHCYSCGGSGHYGPECGLYRGLLSGDATWSKANLQRYLDPTSQYRALSAGVDYSIKSHPKKSSSIKGKANDPITFDDSDDDAEEFIRPKVNNSAGQRGHIHFGPTSSPGNIPPLDHHQEQARESRSMFDRVTRARDDSARYGREPTFSPPPRYREDDFYRGVPENERRNLPQRPQRDGDSYQPAMQGPPQGMVQFPMRGANSSRGAAAGRGRGGGNGARGGVANGGGGKPSRRPIRGARNGA
jgi:hypothetical protein